MQLKERQYPLYIMFHPFDGYQEMKHNKKFSLGLSCLILFLWFAAEILDWDSTGFIFNWKRPEQLNVYLVMVQTFIVFLLWVVANWALCTLMDGEGRFVEIWVASAYALIPYIITSFIVTIFSNVLVYQEGTFLQYAAIIGQIWSVALLFVGMQEIHQYSVKKTLISMFFTVVGIGIIIFLCVLLFSLFQQLYVFLYTIYSELKFRF